jgi:hypothetical protein
VHAGVVEEQPLLDGAAERDAVRSLASTESLAEVWLAVRATAAAPEG